MIHKRTEALGLSKILKKQGKEIVLVTGFFDLLHKEHKKFLQRAKRAGDTLIVCVESDSRARKIKGEDRPIEDQEKRANRLDILPYVDHVLLLTEEFSNDHEYSKLIRDIKPDIYAVSEHTLHQDKKRRMAMEHGGQLRVVYKYNPDISTTQTLQELEQK